MTENLSHYQSAPCNASSGIISGGRDLAAEAVELVFSARHSRIVARFLALHEHRHGRLSAAQRWAITRAIQARLRKKLNRALDKYASPYSLY